MMVAALPFVGAGANGTQLFNTTNRLVPTFGVNWRTFWRGVAPFDSIRGEGFLRRRFTGYLDPLLAVPIYSGFFEKFCLDHYRRDLLASCPKTLRNLFGCNPHLKKTWKLRRPNPRGSFKSKAINRLGADKEHPTTRTRTFVESAAKWLILCLN
jgi:hypothetical protein